MKIIHVKDAAEGGKVAFSILKEAMEQGIQVLGLATGTTPVTLYEEITKSDLDFSDKIAINLDEYIGLPATHPASYHQFMEKHLFAKKPFKKTYLPDGLGGDNEPKRYDAILKEHPIDLQILGIGVNGHIGFNEPGAPFGGKTSKVTLADSTIEANARFFKEEADVPRYAFSLGIKNVMHAKQIVLMAYGEEKAAALDAMMNGPVTEDLPASVLQLHPNVIVITDQPVDER